MEAMGLGAQLSPEAAGAALVLLPSEAAPSRQSGAGSATLRFAPRDFDALFSLVARIGSALDADDAADRWADETRRALARISASSLGERRPQVAPVVSLAPFRLAGGATFESELLEVAGAESVTHGLEEARVGLEVLPEEHRHPELWLWMAADPVDPDLALPFLPPDAVFETFPLPDTWVADPVVTARRLRERVARIGDCPDPGRRARSGAAQEGCSGQE